MIKDTIDASIIQKAGQALREGKLVIFPTETVYGLGANALDAQAVRKVFEAKGRPASNPLIVHVADADAAKGVVSAWPEDAQKLAEIFWPGPLTLVLPKSSDVPLETTAGLDTVAVRVPNHPVALALINAAGVPVAAPSANCYTRLSPTRVEHLDPEILDAASAVLDGGPCELGLESTVLDLSEENPRLLRPGAIPRLLLESVLGKKLALQAGINEPARSPGLQAFHYAPRAKLVLTETLQVDQPGLTFGVSQGPHQISMPNEPREYGAALFASLHLLDMKNYETIYVERPPSNPEWEAVLDRLNKAAAKS